MCNMKEGGGCSVAIYIPVVTYACCHALSCVVKVNMLLSDVIMPVLYGNTKLPTQTENIEKRHIHSCTISLPHQCDI